MLGSSYWGLISIYSNEVLTLIFHFSKQPSCESERQSLAKFAIKTAFISKYCPIAGIPSILWLCLHIVLLSVSCWLAEQVVIEV